MSVTGASGSSVDFESNPPSYHPSFSAQDADIIFVSDDGVLFRVHKFVLQFGSGFFKGMMEMTRDPAEATANEPIRIQENSKVFAMLLDIIYPDREPPALESLEFANEVLQAAEKYEMRKATHSICLLVMSQQQKFLTQQPLEVYALASRYGWVEAAKFASTETLQFDLYSPNCSASLRRLDGDMSLRLFGLHARRRRALLKALNPEVVSIPGVEWANVIVLPTSCSKNHFYTASVRQGPWIILRDLVAQEMEVEPRGNAIRKRSFIDQEALLDMWRFTCAAADCRTIVFSKDRVHAELIRLLDLLPSSI
ncbi:hypothetical protein BD410DRAFT_783588 [Rickenella mellea]|uniref:BTB domain-containing protein n=1 Tax=Rickenella mellea TaxID=50990 RepID=A0A4Y7QFX3_9AGAM|nr:hypothetical protein BD410DRAFT_783588 [Rickenella mellea]